MKLVDMTVSTFSEVMASNAPAPGGGSAAALAGALGAALTSMVSALTVGADSEVGQLLGVGRPGCQRAAGGAAPVGHKAVALAVQPVGVGIRGLEIPEVDRVVDVRGLAVAAEARAVRAQGTGSMTAMAFGGRRSMASRGWTSATSFAIMASGGA